MNKEETQRWLEEAIPVLVKNTRLKKRSNHPFKSYSSSFKSFFILDKGWYEIGDYDICVSDGLYFFPLYRSFVLIRER